MLILINFTFKNIIIPFRGGGMWKCVSHLICLFLQTKPGNVRQVIRKKMYLKSWLIADLHGRSYLIPLHNCRNETLQLPFTFDSNSNPIQLSWLYLKASFRLVNVTRWDYLFQSGSVKAVSITSRAWSPSRKPLQKWTARAKQSSFAFWLWAAT